MTEVWPGNNAMYGRINNGNGNGNGRISNLKTLFDTRPENRGNHPGDLEIMSIRMQG